MAHYRLLMPLLPLLLLLSGEFANFLHTKYSETHYPKLEYVFAFILCITSLITLKNETENTKAGSKFLNCYGHVGEVVASALPENATIAPEGIGKIGYVLPDYEIYDFLGLVDPYTAKNGTMPSPNFTYGKVHYPHMMEIKPEIFIFHTPNFFEPLRNLGYEKEYETYQIKTVPCDFLWIGIRNDVVSETRQRLETKFKIELYK